MPTPFFTRSDRSDYTACRLPSPQEDLERLDRIDELAGKEFTEWLVTRRQAYDDLAFLLEFVERMVADQGPASRVRCL